MPSCYSLRVVIGTVTDTKVRRPAGNWPPDSETISESISPPILPHAAVRTELRGYDLIVNRLRKRGRVHDSGNETRAKCPAHQGAKAGTLAVYRK